MDKVIKDIEEFLLAQASFRIFDKMLKLREQIQKNARVAFEVTPLEIVPDTSITHSVDIYLLNGNDIVERVIIPVIASSEEDLEIKSKNIARTVEENIQSLLAIDDFGILIDKNKKEKLEKEARKNSIDNLVDFITRLDKKNNTPLS